ncbi:MAG: CDP-alcohol phosphatidyltransferase family protein [Pseudomonadota bacterium]
MADPARRPLNSRDTALARRAARWLAGTAVTPNQISAASIVFAGLAGGAFWAAGHAAEPLRSLCLILAALAVQVRLLCNLFDGMVAIEGGKKSADGEFWNEAPDRLADGLILVGLGLGAMNPGLGWAAACFAVLTAYLRALGTTAGLAPDFCGPMAKPHRMALVTGVAVLAAILPRLGAEIDVLTIGLWLVTLGTGFTALRRSQRLVAGLKSRR